jgi:hypothetical protein
MSDFKVKTVKARITSFSMRTATGKIVVGRHKYRFDLTSFRNGRTSRYPASGQDVEAVVSADGKRLVSVWGK